MKVCFVSRTLPLFAKPPLTSQDPLDRPGVLLKEPEKRLVSMPPKTCFPLPSVPKATPKRPEIAENEGLVFLCLWRLLEKAPWLFS